MTNSKSIELNARQALICAAITGWAGDGPCSWQSPMPEKDILAWAQSYSRSATNEELAQAFQALLSEKLFFWVRYPIFTVPVYYCSIDSKFLQELPDEISFVESGSNTDFDRASIVDMWDHFREQYFEENGTAWLKWGLCASQGSQGPSHSQWGPCLGPSCRYFQDGDGECNWELPFIETPRTGWPDLSFLKCIHRAEESASDLEDKATNALQSLKAQCPDYPWPINNDE